MGRLAWDVSRGTSRVGRLNVSYIYIHFFIRSSHIRFSYIYSQLFITSQVYFGPTYNDQLPVGWLAQLVEHCTGIVEVMGSNPIHAGLNFFQALFSLVAFNDVSEGILSIHFCDYFQDKLSLYLSMYRKHYSGQTASLRLL